MKNCLYPFAALIFVSVSFYKCKDGEQLSYSGIQPTFEHFDVPESTYNIDPTSPNIIEVGNGTKITIPANAFADINGLRIEDRLDIVYREFHTLGDVMASGIPMKCMSDGKEEDMISAGMFEITANINGKKLLIVKGKKIKIDMASYQLGNDFEFFELTEQGQWRNNGSCKAKINQSKFDQLAVCEEELQNTPPLKPHAYAKGEPVIDLDVNYSLYPELASLKGIMWQFDTKNETTESKAWIYEENWTGYKLTALEDGEGTYNVEFTNANRKFNCVMKPVLSEATFSEAMDVFVAAKNDYDKKRYEVELRKAQIMREASLVRSFAVNKLGICNWDKFAMQENRIAFNATYSIEGENIDPSNTAMFLVTPEDNLVVKCYQDAQFYFNPDKQNQIIAVLPGDKVAVFAPRDFAVLNDVPLADEGFNFDLKILEGSIANVSDLNAIISAI